MIDIENKVFDTVYNAVISQYPSAQIENQYTELSAVFPCVTIMEVDNYTHKRSLDNKSLYEHNVNVMYECNVFCTGDSAKSDAKAISQIVDSTMQGMKFTRTFYGQTPNEDRTVYRMTLRYTAVVGEGVTSSGTTTYQIYRD